MWSDGTSLPTEVKRFGAALKRTRKRARRKEGKLAGDLAACDKAPEIRKQAELLKSHLQEIPRGADRAVVPDWFSPGAEQTVTIPLDPARPPRETMRKLFKKAAKLERGRPPIEGQIAKNETHIRELDALLHDFDAWRWDAENDAEPVPDELVERARALGAIREEEARSILHARPPTPEEERRERLMRGVRVYQSLNGVPIFVGKSARDNDALSFQIARGNDWWFHAAASAGSHVVARVAERPDNLPEETLLDAASLALHFSKMHAAGKADIHYTQVKYVRRIRGAPPGKVQLMKSKNLMLRLEPDRLDRLLNHR